MKSPDKTPVQLAVEIYENINGHNSSMKIKCPVPTVPNRIKSQGKQHRAGWHNLQCPWCVTYNSTLANLEKEEIESFRVEAIKYPDPSIVFGLMPDKKELNQPILDPNRDYIPSWKKRRKEEV